MQYAVIAYDGTDEEALERRMKVRDAHMQYVVDTRRTKGHLIHGGALLDDTDKMIGSILIVDFPDQQSFDNWYNNDPYVKGNVWQNVQIIPFKTAPAFVGNIPKGPVAASS